jgi:alcohol dehydrogenase class IV
VRFHSAFLSKCEGMSRNSAEAVRLAPCRQLAPSLLPCRISPVALFEAVWEEFDQYPFGPEDTGAVDACDRVSVTQLTLSFRDDVSELDARAILTEYARLTCAEKGVLRCDVLRPVSSKSLAGERTEEYWVWIVFADAMGRADHERSAHASKLRLLLAPKEGCSDNAVVLAKLATSANQYRPRWPRALNSWRTCCDYAPLSSSASQQPMSTASPPASSVPPDGADAGSQYHTNPLRRALDILVANVGLEDAIVLVATANAAEDDYVEDAKAVCARYADDLLVWTGGRSAQLRSSPNSFSTTSTESNGVVRTAVLSTAGERRRITVLQVHDKAHPDGAHFDTGLAADLLDPAGWSVERFVSMFPDLAGWKIVDMVDMPWNTPGREHELASLVTENGLPAEFMPIGEAYRLQQEARTAAASTEPPSPETNDLARDQLDPGAERPKVGDGASAIRETGDVVDVTGVTLDDNGPTESSAELSVTPADSPAVTSQPPLRERLKEAMQATAAHHAGEIIGEPTQQLRVQHGSGAFAQMEVKLRKLCAAAKDSRLRVFAVSGWNEARLQPLVMELDAGMDAGRVALSIGVNVFGASATLAKVAAGVASARRHQSDVIVSFGGGAVLDTGKAVAALAKLSAHDVSMALSRIRDAAEAGLMVLDVIIDAPAVPLMLVPSTVGSCVEVADRALLNATLKDGSVRRISVFFNNRVPPRNMAIVDPRLVIPRRLNSQDAAMGALQALCFAIDVLVCSTAPKQATELATRAIRRGCDAILKARREPVSSDGPARDVIVDAAMLAGLARDTCGGLGVATCLSISMLDGAEPTTCGLDGPLRIIVPRVTAAVASALYRASPAPCLAAQVVVGRENATAKDLSHWILSLAEDIGVSLVGEIGVRASDAERVVIAVGQGGLLTQCADPRLSVPEVLLDVVLETTAQEYQL